MILLGGGDNKMCNLIFSTILSEIILFSRRTQQDIIHAKMSFIKYPLLLSDFDETENVFEFFEKERPNIKYDQNPFSGSRVLPRERTDAQTQMMKLIVAFYSFEHTLKVCHKLSHYK
jgi:hypothetical protein